MSWIVEGRLAQESLVPFWIFFIFLVDMFLVFLENTKAFTVVHCPGYLYCVSVCQWFVWGHTQRNVFTEVCLELQWLRRIFWILLLYFLRCGWHFLFFVFIWSHIRSLHRLVLKLCKINASQIAWCLNSKRTFWKPFLDWFVPLDISDKLGKLFCRLERCMTVV